MVDEGLHGKAQFDVCPDLGQDLLVEGLEFQRPLSAGLLNEGEALDPLASWSEEVKPAKQLAMTISHDRNHLCARKALDRVEVGLAPIDLPIAMAVPPELYGRWVASVRYEPGKEAEEGVGVQFSVGVGDALWEDKDVLDEETFRMICDIAQPGYLGGTKPQEKD